MPAIDPDDAGRWARRLEDARAASATWERARIASTDSLIYLVVDGLYSTSIGQNHWSLMLADRADGEGLPGVWRAFGYGRYGEHYLPTATAGSFQVLLSRWDDYVGRLKPNQRLVPVCFSLGAALALLGLRRWITSLPSARAGEIPAAVLVAPAHAAAPELLDGYLRIAGTLAPHGIPASIRELCNPTSPLRADADAALHDLPGAGVTLHVVYWPADLLTPYQPTSIAGIDERPVLTDKSLAAPRNAVKDHMALRDQAVVLSSVIEVLKGYR